jgi:hypothetical protein
VARAAAPWIAWTSSNAQFGVAAWDRRRLARGERIRPGEKGWVPTMLPSCARVTSAPFEPGSRAAIYGVSSMRE